MKKITLVLVAFLMTVTLTACGSSSGSDSSTVVVAKDVDVMTMDSILATDGMSFEVISATIDGLFTIDKEGNPLPALSDGEPTVSEDGKTITFKLKDAKWSNGEAVTANDFVFAWQRLADPKTASEYSYMLASGVAEVVNADEVIAGTKDKSELGVKAIDEKTLEVKVNKSVPFFNSLLSFPVFFPQNEKFVTEQGDQYAQTPANFLSCGPFKFEAWTAKSEIKLVKNDQYWDKDNVKTENLTFKIIADANPSALSFDNEEVDFSKLSGQLVEKYKDNENFKNVLDGYLWFLSINVEKTDSALDNVNLRKAIALSINKDDIANDILKDGSVGADYFIPKELATGPDGKDYRESTGTYLGFDEAKAKELYETAKAETGKTAFNIELLYEEEGNIKQVAEFIKSKVEANLPGVTFTLKSQPKKNRIELMKTQSYDIAIHRWGPDYADPTTYFNIVSEGNSQNYGMYAGTEFNALMNEASTTTDLTERWTALQKAEKVLLEDDAAVIPLYQVGGATLVRKNVTGIENHTVGVPYIYKNIAKSAE